jgi:ribosomal-protein-serine acetyltransferase
LPVGSIRLPHRLETARLVLRCYDAADVAAWDDAATRSIDHIGQFMPTVRAELLGDRAALLADARRAFDAGERFEYGVFLPDGSFVGNCGGHLFGKAELNIGYWVVLEHVRKGYASEAVTAVTAAGFGAGVRRFVLHCHPANVASIGVASSAGFTYLSTDAHETNDGVRYEEMTWELRRELARV